MIKRSYTVLDRTGVVPPSQHPTADEALAHGRFLAASMASAQGLARVVEDPCEDGTMLFGEYGDLPGELVALVSVDELGRGPHHI